MKMDKYQNLYGHIPKDTLSYILDNYRVSTDKVDVEIRRIDALSWHSIECEIPIVPKPTPRPKYNFNQKHFYVHGAAKNKNVIRNYIMTNQIIFTQVQIDIVAYYPTPNAMNGTDIYLAELGKIRPVSPPDVDNVEKSVLDAMTDIVISNDAFVIKSAVAKYYSIRPRIYVRLDYLNGFDSKFNYDKLRKQKYFITHGILPQSYIEDPYQYPVYAMDPE